MDMAKKIILFDMDGVLLKSGGYRKALRASVRRTAVALGAPNVDLSEQQISQFEALHITNEWDSLAICAALLLVEVWKKNPAARLNGASASPHLLLIESSLFDRFLSSIPLQGSFPGEFAYEWIIRGHPWIDEEQQQHLKKILFHCRDIYQSPTLPAHQESVLGSDLYYKTYGLEPQTKSDGFLFTDDIPILSSENHDKFCEWLSKAENYAGIMTNRPSRSPKGHISPPEAEIGVNLIKFDDLPVLATGLLTWYAREKCDYQSISFLKPHPVHTLGLLQMILGNKDVSAVDLAVAAWKQIGNTEDWDFYHGSKIWVFEDSVNGLQSVHSACNILNQLGIEVESVLIGVTTDPIKRNAMTGIADTIVSSINDVDWNKISKIKI